MHGFNECGYVAAFCFCAGYALVGGPCVPDVSKTISLLS